jgi:hypothetical protein
MFLLPPAGTSSGFVGIRRPVNMEGGCQYVDYKRKAVDYVLSSGLLFNIHTSTYNCSPYEYYTKKLRNIRKGHGLAQIRWNYPRSDFWRLKTEQ